MDRLKSKRMSIASYRTPITRVKGTLAERRMEERTGQFAKPGQKDVILKITNIQEVEADTPYPYKTAEIRLKFSDYENSSWTIFEDSIAALLNETDVSIDDLVGCVVTLEKQKEALTFVGREGEQRKGDLWKVTAIEGKAANALNYALQLLHGKTQAEFEKAVMNDDVVRKDVRLFSMIMSGGFYTLPEVTSKYKIEGGRYTTL